MQKNYSIALILLLIGVSLAPQPLRAEGGDNGLADFLALGVVPVLVAPPIYLWSKDYRAASIAVGTVETVAVGALTYWLIKKYLEEEAARPRCKIAGCRQKPLNALPKDHEHYANSPYCLKHLVEKAAINQAAQLAAKPA